MKVVKTVIAILAILAGIIWFLQGINVLGESAMSGQSRIVIAGLVAFGGGVVILVDTWRQKSAD